MKATHNLASDTTTDLALTPAALLRGAALYLQQHGWTRGEFFDLLESQPFPRACALGAINICAHGRPILASDDGSEDLNSDAAITAMRVLAAFLDTGYATGAADTSAIDIVAAFNDDPATTFDELIDMLNEAADDWDKAHGDRGAR